MPSQIVTAAEMRSLLTKPKRSKFGVAPKAQRTYEGVVYDSKAEARYAMKLDAQLKGGIIREWRRQIPFPLVVNGALICKHFIDFKVIRNDGSIRLIEVKGFETPEWKLKRKLLFAVFPTIVGEYEVVR